MSLTAGDVLQNRYRIVSPLGQGGMGAVYRAWDTRLKAPMALKEMIPQPGLNPRALAQLRAQFEQEAVILARLNHPHLVRVTDFFEEGGNAYLVMDFVEGESLADRIEREGSLPEAQVLEWSDQLLDALAHCHAQGIIHRDVKPQNVMIRPDGRAVLVDFGLVKLWDPRDPRTRTVMRGMGTTEYATPEQYGTQPGHTGPCSDLYSLGTTLYHALTGQAPPTASDRMAAPDQFVPVRSLNPRVSGKTEAIILRAMELPLASRFQSAAEMGAAMGGGGAVAQARPAPPKRQPTKVMPGAQPAAPAWHKRIPAWTWALGGVALLALALVVGVLILVAGALTSAGGGATSLPPPSPTPAGSSLGDTWTRPTDGMVMVYVPAGEFEMGSTEGDSDEQPVHTVALDGFWMDQTGVTNAQFAAFLNERGNQTEGSATWLELEDEDCLIERVSGEFRSRNGYVEHPVIEVSWYGAAAYCEWVGGRLPTEAEWEYAARGPDGHIYPWGNDAPTCERAHFGECSGRTVPVGSLPAGASWCNALDMAGNVWEWVADWYGEYASGRQVNPTGPSSGAYRVLRGGSWDIVPNLVRGANRGRLLPDATNNDGGFRCARGSQ